MKKIKNKSIRNLNYDFYYIFDKIWVWFFQIKINIPFIKKNIVITPENPINYLQRLYNNFEFYYFSGKTYNIDNFRLSNILLYFKDQAITRDILEKNLKCKRIKAQAIIKHCFHNNIICKGKNNSNILLLKTKKEILNVLKNPEAEIMIYKNTTLFVKNIGDNKNLTKCTKSPLFKPCEVSANY